MRQLAIKPTKSNIASSFSQKVEKYKPNSSLSRIRNIKKKTKTLIKNFNKIDLWLTNHNFDTKKYKKSSLISFLINCPLGKSTKRLCIHSMQTQKDLLPLILKETEQSIFFTLKKNNNTFIIKTSKYPLWIFNQKGDLIERIEHKKVKIWLVAHGLSISSKSKTDLETFISSCPVCKIPNLLHYHRSTEKKLDLQCSCLSYFKLSKKPDNFIFTMRDEILKIFDNTGKDITTKI